MKGFSLLSERKSFLSDPILHWWILSSMTIRRFLTWALSAEIFTLCYRVATNPLYTYFDKTYPSVTKIFYLGFKSCQDFQRATIVLLLYFFKISTFITDISPVSSFILIKIKIYDFKLWPPCKRRTPSGTKKEWSNNKDPKNRNWCKIEIKYCLYSILLTTYSEVLPPLAGPRSCSPSVAPVASPPSLITTLHPFWIGGIESPHSKMVDTSGVDIDLYADVEEFPQEELEQESNDLYDDVIAGSDNKVSKESTKSYQL